MKDSQLPPERLPGKDKYIKESNERFSTQPLNVEGSR